MHFKAVHDPQAQLSGLAILARAEGHHHLDRLLAEFRQGTNRFEQPGEQLLGAFEQSRLVGVCGLNRDPYQADPAVGRIRRLYVERSRRRCGIASALVRRLEVAAAPTFKRAQLFTSSVEASRFYIALGFLPVQGRPKVSHAKLLAVD